MRFLDDFFQDLRYAFRSLGKSPGFAAVAVATLALGIGANTTVFSLVNALLFEPLPFEAPSRLVWIANSEPGGGLSAETHRVSTFEAFEQAESFAELTAYEAFFGRYSFALTGDGDPVRLKGVPVAQNFFSLLGVEPAVGRTFLSEESQLNGPRAVMLSHDFWQSRYGGRPDVIGRSIMLNSEPYAVVGVLPASFDFASVFAPGVDVPLIFPMPFDMVRNWGNTLAVVGRLAPGLSLHEAQAEGEILIERTQQQYPQYGDEYRASLSPLDERVSGSISSALLLAWCAVGAVLLIACVNVSNLLLARETSRRREIAVRAALGAGRGRLTRQLLTESLLLTACGGALGIAFAYFATAYLTSLEMFRLPLLTQVAVDQAALVVSVLTAGFTALLVGALPALRLADPASAEALKESSRGVASKRGAGTLRGALVASQVALACVLLVVAGLLVRSLFEALTVDLGFRPERALALRIDTGTVDPLELSRERQVAWIRELVAAAQTVPGVTSAAVTDALPFDRNRSWYIAPRGEQAGEELGSDALVRMIGPDYLETMGIALTAGREFSDRDTAESQPVVIINETTARRLWPGEDPIGRLSEVFGEREVIGVAADARHLSLEEEEGMGMYLPIYQMPSTSLDLVVRTLLEPAAVAPDLRAALRRADPDLPLGGLRPLGDLVERVSSPRRFFATLLGLFASAALLLAALGIYGVTAYLVGRRTSEIGLRIALGAKPRDVLALVFRQGLAPVALGAAVGFLAALAAGRVFAGLLFGVEAADFATLAGAAAALFLAAALACYLPARRAAAIEPLEALRAE